MELCVCETIAKEMQKIKVFTEKKKFGKVYTVVDGIDDKNIDIKEVAKKLKNRLACGGTYKDGKIELQGNHMGSMREALIRAGFAPETIELQ